MKIFENFLFFLHMETMLSMRILSNIHHLHCGVIKSALRNLTIENYLKG